MSPDLPVTSRLHLPFNTKLARGDQLRWAGLVSVTSQTAVTRSPVQRELRGSTPGVLDSFPIKFVANGSCFLVIEKIDPYLRSKATIMSPAVNSTRSPSFGPVGTCTASADCGNDCADG